MQQQNDPFTTGLFAGILFSIKSVLSETNHSANELKISSSAGQEVA